MTLNDIRRHAAAAIALLTLILAASTFTVDLMVNGSIGMGSTLAAAGVVALVACFAVYRTTLPFRLLSVAVMMGQVMALLISAQDQPWQTDIHMAFFAALAITALLYDIRAIILGTALVAVHHLGLGMVLPELIFYAGGGFARILLHAVVLVIEAAGLIWMTHNTVQLFALARHQSEVAEVNASEARALAVEVQSAAETHKADRKRTLAELRAEFGNVAASAAEGDFSRRVRHDFDEDDLNVIAASINRLVETVESGLHDTTGVLGAMSRQDLTRRIDGDYRGAFGTLKVETNTLADRLAEILHTLQLASQNLKQATQELLAGSNDLSRRTHIQATTVQEAAASVENLTRTIAENARRALEADDASHRVVGIANEGGEIMQSATGAMQRIAKSSEEISGIIGLIDDIAFQTNLLALNASVEAARAGEAGKGFAVVAIEVRRLAQSAAQASSQVKGLIGQSAGEVGDGAKLVGRAAQTLSRIVDAARSSNALMQEIAGQAEAQKHAIEEVNLTVRQIDENTQHNAALIEQTNVAIEQTQAQAAALDAITAAFTTDAEERSAAA